LSGSTPCCAGRAARSVVETTTPLSDGADTLGSASVFSYITFSVALTSIGQPTRHDLRNAPLAQ
jgi:hypothetical protein